MRLWHKDLIPVLPRQQLLGQWRECCLIAKNIAEKGTPDHILVNKVMNYPLELDFYMYCCMVQMEMKNRGYKAFKGEAWVNFCNHLQKAVCNKPYTWDPEHVIFDGWHNARYYLQCYFNLQEKFDCGGISIEEWGKIEMYNHRRALDEWIEQWKENHKNN